MNPAAFFKEDRIVGILIFIASAAYGWGAYEMSGLNSDDAVGPAGFPILIALSGIGLSTWLIAKPDEEAGEGLGGIVWWYWLAFLVYAASMPLIGFGISSALFLVATFLVLRAPVRAAVLVALIATSILVLIFGYLFELRISIGPWHHA